MKHPANRRGFALLMALGYLAVLSMAASVFLVYLNRAVTQGRNTELKTVALHLADAGVDKALAALQTAPEAYAGEAQTPLGEGRFSVEIERNGAPGQCSIISTGEVTDGDRVLSRARVVAEARLDPDGAVRSLDWTEVAKW